jgi:hypothetical protein
LLCPPGRQTFERGDLLFRPDIRQSGDTGTDLLAVDQNGTSATLCQPTAELGTGKEKLVAEDVEKRRIAGRLDFSFDGIHGNGRH